MFPCQDIREEQLEKTIAYVQALQYWVERSNLPTVGKPCLLVRGILKLRETMEQYVSFLDDTILDGVALLEGFFKDQTEITIPEESLPIFTDVPAKRLPWRKWPPSGDPSRNQLYPKCCMRSRADKVRASPNQFPSWRKVLHPSQPVTATGHASVTLHKSGWRHHNQSSQERRVQC